MKIEVAEKYPILKYGESLDSYVRREADQLNWSKFCYFNNLNNLSFKTVRDYFENWDWLFILLNHDLSNEFLIEFKKEFFSLDYVIFDDEYEQEIFKDDKDFYLESKSVISLKAKLIFRFFWLDERNSFMSISDTKFNLEHLEAKIEKMCRKSMFERFKKIKFENKDRELSWTVFFLNEFNETIELKGSIIPNP